MAQKVPAPQGLRPASPRLKRINPKFVMAATGIAVGATVAVFAFDPGFGMGAKEKEPQPPMLSNVAPVLDGLPQDYSGMGRPSQVAAATAELPRPPLELDIPKAPVMATEKPPPVQQPIQPRPSNPRPVQQKTAKGIMVGGDDGLDDYMGASGGPVPGVQMVADDSRYGWDGYQSGMDEESGGYGGRQPPMRSQHRRSAAQDFRAQNRGQSEMYLQQSVTDPLGEWEIWPGTIIPAKLATATNSELGGHVTARVSADIYDNRSGRCRMIPRDSTVFGKLSDSVEYGNRRQQAVWTMLILPNGRKLDLMGMDATDGSGRAGMEADVNNHIGRLAVAAIGATALDVLGQVASWGEKNSGTEINIGGPAVDNVTSIGRRIIDRELQVRPTLEQVIGHPVSLMVDRTIQMGCYDER